MENKIIIAILIIIGVLFILGFQYDVSSILITGGISLMIAGMIAGIMSIYSSSGDDRGMINNVINGGQMMENYEFKERIKFYNAAQRDKVVIDSNEVLQLYGEKDPEYLSKLNAKNTRFRNSLKPGNYQCIVVDMLSVLFEFGWNFNKKEQKSTNKKKISISKYHIAIYYLDQILKAFMSYNKYLISIHLVLRAFSLPGGIDLYDILPLTFLQLSVPVPMIHLYIAGKNDSNDFIVNEQDRIIINDIIKSDDNYENNIKPLFQKWNYKKTVANVEEKYELNRAIDDISVMLIYENMKKRGFNCAILSNDQFSDYIERNMTATTEIYKTKEYILYKEGENEWYINNGIVNILNNVDIVSEKFSEAKKTDLISVGYGHIVLAFEEA